MGGAPGVRGGVVRLGLAARQEVLAASVARLGLETASVTEDGLSAALSAAAGRGFELSRELPLRAHLFAIEAEDALAQTSSSSFPTEHVLLLEKARETVAQLRKPA